MNANGVNGTALNDMPTASAHPDVIRQAQFLLDAARQGKIVGFEAVGVCPDGNVMHLHAMLQNSPAIHVAIGGLQVLIADLTSMLQQMRQQNNVPKILRPAMGMMSQG